MSAPMTSVLCTCPNATPSHTLVLFYEQRHHDTKVAYHSDVTVCGAKLVSTI
ncbi:hypothetical protein [Massilia sp. S19_KUP03_FR1]|uniref:hypothetical protein n=1 Tax=Massilia sp. S19_KUP03_FR1 TaxID=3025503 RepID=UPI002FCD9DED